MSAHSPAIPTAEQVTLPADSMWRKLPIIGAVLALVGLGGLFGMGSEHGEHWFAYLTAFMFFMTLAVGSLFFCVIFFLTRSGWNVAIRRIAEASAATAPLFLLLALPVLFGGLETLYHWAHPGAAEHDVLIAHKEPYLNKGFFIGRAIVYFASFALFAWIFVGNSVKQDKTGDHAITRKLQAIAAPAIAVCSLALTFAAFDFNMSLYPHWFSTIYGVIHFAGGFMANFAFLIIVVTMLYKGGVLKNVVTEEHLHAMGKMMFGLTCFWAYVSFSQFMLIWYANIPEETVWYQYRWEGSWKQVSLLLLIGHFAVPFFLFMSRHVKRSWTFAPIFAGWMLAMHYLDMYWMVMPNIYHGNAHFGLSEILAVVGVGGFFLAGFGFFLQRAPVVAIRDPRLPESLKLEN